MQHQNICLTPSDQVPEDWNARVISARGDLDDRKNRIIVDAAVDNAVVRELETNHSLRVEKLKELFSRQLLERLFMDRQDPVRGMIVRTQGHDVLRDNTDLLHHADWLDVVVRAGIGVDEILAKSMLANGTKMMNTPEANRDTVHKMTVGKMTELLSPLNRNRRETNRMVRGLIEPQWKASSRVFSPESVQEPFNGKKVFIIGLGGIGERVAYDCSRMGAEVLFTDIDPSKQAYFARRVELSEGLAQADIISVHVNGEKRVIGPEQMRLINPEGNREVLFLNTARGAVVDGDALFDMVESGRIAGGYIDVLPEEEEKAFSKGISEKLMSLEPLLEVTRHMLGGRTDALEYNARDAANKVVGALRSGVVRDSFGGANMSLPPHLWENGGPIHMLELINYDVAGVHDAVEERLKSAIQEFYPGYHVNISGATTRESEYKVDVPKALLAVEKPGDTDGTTRMAFHLSRWEMPGDISEQTLREVIRSCIVGDEKVPGLLKMRIRRYSKPE